MPSSSAARYSSGWAMWAWTRSASRPASTASSTSRRTSSGVASASPGGSAAGWRALRNSRSPLIEHTQSFHATSRSPVRRDRRSLTSPSTSSSTSMSVSGWAPSARGHHSARPVDVERPLDLVGRRRRAGARSRRRRRRRRSCARGPSGRVAVEAGVQPEVGTDLVGVAAQHAQAVELHRTGVVHEHRPPQPARVPVAVDGLGVLEHARDVAPAVVPRSGLHVDLDGEHVVVAEPRQRGDVEAVGEEVALRVPEVGAVEPDVGLVEDAVERDPAPPAGVGGGRSNRRAVEDRPVARGERRVAAPVSRDADLGPAAVVDVEPGADRGGARRRPSMARHGPESSTARQASDGARLGSPAARGGVGRW